MTNVEFLELHLEESGSILPGHNLYWKNGSGRLPQAVGITLSPLKLTGASKRWMC